MNEKLFENNIDVNSLIKTLAHDVPQGVSDSDSNPAWTISVTDVLHKMGRKLGYQVQSRRTDANLDCHEWLLDIVWLHPPPGIAMELAAESEWGNPGCVQDDFQKLLCTKASVKVMLFAYKKGSQDSQTVWDGLKTYMNNYPHHLAGETYILMEFQQDNCRYATLRVQNNGQQFFDFALQEIGLPSQATKTRASYCALFLSREQRVGWTD
jgi:hypothetical protein